MALRGSVTAWPHPEAGLGPISFGLKHDPLMSLRLRQCTELTQACCLVPAICTLRLPAIAEPGDTNFQVKFQSRRAIMKVARSRVPQRSPPTESPNRSNRPPTEKSSHLRAFSYPSRSESQPGSLAASGPTPLSGRAQSACRGRRPGSPAPQLGLHQMCRLILTCGPGA